LIVVLSFRIRFAGNTAALAHCPDNGRFMCACIGLLATCSYEPEEQIAILCISPFMSVRRPDTRLILNVVIICFS
jgi:hypothetical protein